MTTPITLPGSRRRAPFSIEVWLESDLPIKTTSQDVLEHSPIAERIAERLVSVPPHSQAVLGPLGSGKSSLRNLVSARLLGAKNSRGETMEIVPIELWRFDTSRAAVEEIIRSLIEAIGREVSVVGLRSLPSEYAEAMTAAGGAWSAIVSLQGTSSSPDELLCKFDRVAETLATNYVLWIEDLERFAGGRPHLADEPESREESERLAPVRALLHALGLLQHVVIVTASTSLRMRVDLDKIARFIEEVPTLAEHNAARLIGDFRVICLDKFRKSGGIDPNVLMSNNVSRRVSQDGDLSDIGDAQRIAMRQMFFGKRLISLADAIPVLCRTPRTLKLALRRTHHSWNRLMGEIDFDTLLCFNIVRAAIPDAFATICAHSETLRMRVRSGGVREDEHREGLANWNKAMAALSLDSRARDAIELVVKFVFGSSPTFRFQGASEAKHTDYLQRVLTESVLAGESDQVVLKAIASRQDEEVLNLLESKSRAAAALYYARLIPTTQLIGMLVHLARRRASELPTSWPGTADDKEIPALIPVWQMWMRRSEEGELEAKDAFSGIVDAIGIAMTGSLYVVAELESHFVATATDVTRVLNDPTNDYSAQAQALMRRMLRQEFTQRPERLAAALIGARQGTLLRICWGLDRIRNKDLSGLPFDGWPEFADTIVAATALSPSHMLRQLAPFVVRDLGTKFVGEALRTDYAFDPEMAFRLFGSADKLIALAALARSTDIQSGDAAYVQALLSIGSKEPEA